MTDTLSRRQTVTDVVRVYESAVADIRSAFAQVAAAERRLNDTFTMEHCYPLHVRTAHHYLDFDDPDETLKMLKRDVWSWLIGRLEIMRVMSLARARELDARIKRDELPEITEANVWEFAAEYSENARDLIVEAVEEVFDFLRPRRSKYKTNSELEVGERVILAYRVEREYSGTKFRVHGSYEQELRALENVFLALDGAVSPKTHRSEIATAIHEAPQGRGETRYFEFKCYDNRNLHLRFRRLDLLARFNEIAGGRRLRPSVEETAA